MTENGRDCLGPGNYYQLEPLGAEFSSHHANATQQSVRSEDRIDPDTGEAYCLSALTDDLHNPDWYVRIRAAWALGSTGDIEAILPLVDALADEHHEVRERTREALRALDAGEEPLPVRVLLCSTIDDSKRADILLALAGSHGPRGPLHGIGTAKSYCEHWLDEETVDLDADERQVLEEIKCASRAVLRELKCRTDARVLLRAGDNTGESSRHLVRAAEPERHAQFHEELLTPVAVNPDKAKQAAPKADM